MAATARPVVALIPIGEPAPRLGADHHAAPAHPTPSSGCRARSIAAPGHADLDQLAATLRQRSACARARTLCEDLAEQLGRLEEVLIPGGPASAGHAVKPIWADLRADAGELAVWALRVARQAQPPAAGDACPQCGMPACACAWMAAGAGGVSELGCLLDLVDEQLRDAALGHCGAGRRALALTSRLLAGIDAVAGTGPVPELQR